MKQDFIKIEILQDSFFFLNLILECLAFARWLCLVDAKKLIKSEVYLKESMIDIATNISLIWAYIFKYFTMLLSC